VGIGFIHEDYRSILAGLRELLYLAGNAFIVEAEQTMKQKHRNFIINHCFQFPFELLFIVQPFQSTKDIKIHF
jgi:hypothetical protein